ncbi:MAG: outer membrane beta-barrel protein [Cyclobacteriaceae bacterium]|nr:outer membrane beta-barrel protein [Cyclobacteriaceae bacterium]
MTKKLLIIVVILTGNVFISRAQVGVQVGIMSQTEAFPNIDHHDERLGGILSYTTGITYEYRINKLLTVRPELNWLHKRWGGGWEYTIFDVIVESEDANRTMTINYLELPLQLILTSKGNEGFMIGGGPAIQYGISGNMKTTSTTGINESEYPYKFNEPYGEKSLTLGVNLMLGYRFNKVHLTLNCNKGLTNRDENPDTFFINHGNDLHFSLRVGYTFLKSDR